MRITISFSNEESRALLHAVATTGVSINNKMEVKDEHIAGSFGEFKFDASENKITVDLKSAFIEAYAHLCAGIVNMVKSFGNNYFMFYKSWFEDAKDLTITKTETNGEMQKSEEIKDTEKESISE